MRTGHILPIAALLMCAAGCIEDRNEAPAETPDGDVPITDATLDRDGPLLDGGPPDAVLPDAVLPDATRTDGAPPDAAPDASPDPDVTLDMRLDSPADAGRDMALELDAAVDMALEPDAAPEPDMELPPDGWVRPVACDDPLAFPVRPRVEAELLPEFAAGDMAFDRLGRIAMIDRDGDLYRAKIDGRRELWAERVALTPRGLAFLSNGALVVADSGRGMLIMVYPGGEVRTLVDHMDAPFGLDVDHDDRVYVSEATRAAITRVDPSTGETERLADALPFVPQALAFSPEEDVLYISARDSGVVYAMPRDGDGDGFGPVRVHAVLPTVDEAGLGICGDGELDDLEQCDDGNGRAGDGCGVDCAFDPYNGDVDDAGGVYPLVFDDDGLARVVYTTDARGDVDRFAFTLDAPAAVSVYTRGMTGELCNGDTIVGLYPADDVDPLAENDDDPQGALGTCSRIAPASDPAVRELPAGEYLIIARQKGPNQLERDGNLLVVRRIEPLHIGSPCGGVDDGLRCPVGSYCAEADGQGVCVEDVCGDGHRSAVEPCDDGNDLPGDGCAADCTFDPYNGAADADDAAYPLAFDASGLARVVFTSDAPDDLDRFTFTLDAPAALTVQTRALAGEGCAGNTIVSLFRVGDGAPIALNVDDPLEVLGRCSRIYPEVDVELAALPAGEYEVVVQQVGGAVEPEGNWLMVLKVPEALALGEVCEGLGDWMDCPFGSECRAVDGLRVCAEHVCGDGDVAEGEICDDGNLVGGDGCGVDCTLDPYNGAVDADDGVYPLEFDARGVARVIYTTDAPGDVDHFGFTLEVPTSIEILTTDLGGDGCNADTVVELVGENGAIGHNDDDPTRQRRLCSLLRPVEIPALHALPAGDYVINARQFSGNRTEPVGNWLIVRPASVVEDGGAQQTDRACAGLTEGDACRVAFGELGLCVIDSGVLRCLDEEEAEVRCGAVGAECEGDDGPGVCDQGLDGFFCRTGPACALETVGEPCQSDRTFGPGVCELRGRGEVVCQTFDPCDGLVAGDPCRVRGQAGACRDDGRDGEPYCQVPTGGAAITALDTDACGHVYAGDGASQAVWRISPDGQDVGRFAALDRGDVTGLAFVPGGETLFVVGHGGADVVSLPVGLPGRPMVRPLRDDTVPDTPEDPRTFRCLDVPSAPVEITELGRPRGYHDVAFDDQGYIIGFDGTALVAVDSDDRLVPYAPGVSGVEGMDFMADGSLVALTRNGLIRIAPNGAQEVLAGELHGYGVTVGPDGRIYVGDNRSVLWRVDVDTGVVEPFLDASQLQPSFSPRNIAFDLDASLMYIGEFGSTVYVLSLDENLDPIGEPRFFATVQPDVRWVDGLTVDACGQVYAPNFETATLNRARPDGGMILYHQWASSQYGHNVVFGSGVGRWRRDAIYLPQPYDGRTVVEVVVGVEGAQLAPIELP